MNTSPEAEKPVVVLIGNYLLDRQESMLRFRDLIESRLKAAGYTTESIYPQGYFGSMIREGPLAKWLGYIDKYLLFPPRLAMLARGYDRVHICDHSNAVYLPYAGAAASITCHDLIAVNAALGRYPGQSVGRAGRLLQRWILNALRRAARVVSVSAKTEDDLRALGWRGAGVVIGNPQNFDFHRVGAEEAAAVKAKHGLGPDERYLIHVGGNQWYKNRAGVVKIFAELARREPFKGWRLLMIGKSWPASLRQLVQDLGLTDRIIEATKASNEDIRALYSGAEALLFPSLEEGFGWPVIEAQVCGCPVITSARSPMLEIAGDAAVFIDPENPAAAANTIEAAIPRLSGLAAKGLENAHRFDRDKIMDQYAAFLAGR